MWSIPTLLQHTCPANAMHVILHASGEVIVDDCHHIGHIQTTSSHICGHKDRHLQPKGSTQVRYKHCINRLVAGRMRMSALKRCWLALVA